MSSGPRPGALEIAIGAATVMVSTFSSLIGSAALGMVGAILGAISFGIVLGVRSLSD